MMSFHKHRETSKVYLLLAFVFGVAFCASSLMLCAIYAPQDMGMAATAVISLWGIVVGAAYAAYSDRAKAKDESDNRRRELEADAQRAELEADLAAEKAASAKLKKERDAARKEADDVKKQRQISLEEIIGKLQSPGTAG